MKKILSWLFVACFILASFSSNPIETYAASTTYGGYINSALNLNKAIDLDGGYTNNGTRVQLWDFNRTAAQGFRFEKRGSYYAIVHSKSRRVLDVDGGVARNGTRVILWDYHGGKNQLWTIRKEGGGLYSFKSALGNYYLDVCGGNTQNGTQIQIYQRNNSKAQRFRIQDDVTYTYKSYRLKFSTMDEWIRAIKGSQQNACGISSGYIYNSKGSMVINGGVIVGSRVLKTKTITVRAQVGQNVGMYRNYRVQLPYEIEYTIHKHHYDRSATLSFQDITCTYSCTCGYHDVYRWEIPWPNSGDAQTTGKIIKAINNVQEVPKYAYWQ